MKNKSYPFNEKDNEELYGEEIDYYIDTISNIKENLNNNTDKSSEIINNINNIPMSKD